MLKLYFVLKIIKLVKIAPMVITSKDDKKNMQRGEKNDTNNNYN